MANEIVLREYDRACWQLEKALSEAKDVAAIKRVHGAATAIKIYAKLAGDKKACADAWEIRQRAERTLGDMMANGKDDRAPEGRPKTGSGQNPFPTLPELGIGKGLANRARRLHELSEKDFGLYLIDGRANVAHHVENAPQLKAKPKKKPKPNREFDCPHCGKLVYLTGGKLTMGAP